MRGPNLLGSTFEPGFRQTSWRVVRVHPFGILTIVEEDLIEYLFDTSVNVDRSTLEQFLIKAGVALEISNIPSSAKSKKKKNTEPTYSMAVAEQMIMTVVTLLHNDRSASEPV